LVQGESTCAGPAGVQHGLQHPRQRGQHFLVLLIVFLLVILVLLLLLLLLLLLVLLLLLLLLVLLLLLAVLLMRLLLVLLLTLLLRRRRIERALPGFLLDCVLGVVLYGRTGDEAGGQAEGASTCRALLAAPVAQGLRLSGHK
jgi:hypothetical protein